MKNETRNDEAVSPVIATILMVAITVVLAGVLYVWAANLAESNTDGDLALYSFSGADSPVADQVLVTMAQGSDTNFATLDIKVSVDGGQGTNCDNTCYGESGTANQQWDVGEDLTITVSCGTGDTTCAVTVTIVDNREGTTLGQASVFME